MLLLIFFPDFQFLKKVSRELAYSINQLYRNKTNQNTTTYYIFLRSTVLSKINANSKNIFLYLM